MNPKRCMKCLLHGESNSHGPTLCPVAKCPCRKCQLIDNRREITKKLVKLDRERRIHFGIRDTNSGYSCARCRNHGTLVIKKNHTPCPYSLCKCEPCLLLAEKKILEGELTQICKEANDSENSSSQFDFDFDRSPTSRSVDSMSHSPDAQERKSADQLESSFEVITSKSTDLSPEAKVILKLIEALSMDPNTFDPDSFDHEELFNFFNKETILLPDSWFPELDDIFDLVHEALRRFPKLRGIQYNRRFQPIV